MVSASLTGLIILINNSDSLFNADNFNHKLLVNCSDLETFTSNFNTEYVNNP